MIREIVPFQRASLRSFGVAIAVLMVGFISASLYSSDARFAPFLPSATNIALFCLSLLLIMMIRNPLSRFFYAVWVMWPVIGTMNIIANALGPRFGTGPQAAFPEIATTNTIHILFVLGLGLSMIVYDRTVGKGVHRSVSHRPHHFKIEMSVLETGVLIIFPILYFAAFYAAVGSIPIFSSHDITATMYNIDKGQLLPLKAWLLASLCYSGLKFAQRSDLRGQLFWALVFLATTFISIADGKRRSVLLALLSLVAIYILKNGGKVLNRNVVMVSVAVVAVSIFVTSMRSVGGIDLDKPFLQYFSYIGDAYWEFAKSINFYSREYVNSFGYDFVKSAIGSTVQRNILALIGIDKNLWVALDSGNTWKALTGSAVGIRTGLVCELWYAFGAFGLIFMFAFGWLISILNAAIIRTCNERNFLILIAFYGLFMSAVNGQWSVLLSMMTVLIYLYIALFTLGKISHILK